MTTATAAIALDDAKAEGSVTSSFREALAARVAAELDGARRIPPVPVYGDTTVVDEDFIREQREVADEVDGEVAAAVAAVEQNVAAIVDTTEKEVDALVAALVVFDPDEVLRPAVKARIRPHLVAWPTPWVRARELVDAPVRGVDTQRRVAGPPGQEEREARRQHPGLDALARIGAEHDARKSSGDDPLLLQGTRDFLVDYRVDPVAGQAWGAVGDAAEAGAALRLAARLAGVDLARTARPFPPDPRDDGPRLARGDVDHVEVPGVGWVYASTLALVGRALWQTTRPAELAALAAHIVLDGAGAGELARHPTAHRTLAREVEDWLSRAPACSDEVEVVDGVHPLDEALAALLDSTGEAGRKLGGEVRGSSKSPEDRARRWRPYVDPLRVPRLLARALWRDVVGPRVERMANPVGAPGLALHVATNLIGMSRRGTQPNLISPDRADILDHRGRRVGSLHLTPSIDASLVELTILGTLAATRFIRFFLHRTYDQKHIQQLPDANRVDVEGGFPALAEMIGATGGKAAEELHAALDTLSAIRIDTPQGDGQVFGYFHHKAARNRRARLEMHGMGPFTPDYIGRTLAGYRGDARHKYLVPVPLPELLPPLSGKRNDHAAQAHLQVLVLREMRIRAVEMVETGAVEIGPRRWDELRDEAAVPKSTLPTVLTAYMTGDKEGRPAFLQAPTVERYALTEPYKQERDAILQAGEAMRAGAKGGRKAAASKRAGKPKRKPKP